MWYFRGPDLAVVFRLLDYVNEGRMGNQSAAFRFPIAHKMSRTLKRVVTVVEDVTEFERGRTARGVA